LGNAVFVFSLISHFPIRNAQPVLPQSVLFAFLCSFWILPELQDVRCRQLAGAALTVQEAAAQNINQLNLVKSTCNKFSGQQELFQGISDGCKLLLCSLLSFKNT